MTITARHRRPTLVDVGRLAGVSAATASRALNGHPSVEPARAERVQAAAEHLGYVTDATARAVSGGTSSTIALVITPSDPPASLDLVCRITEAAARQGLSVLVASIGHDSPDAAPTIRQLRTHHPRCMVVVGRQNESDHQRLLDELDHYVSQGGHSIWITPPDPTVVSTADHHQLTRTLAANVVDIAANAHPTRGVNRSQPEMARGADHYQFTEGRNR